VELEVQSDTWNSRGNWIFS